MNQTPLSEDIAFVREIAEAGQTAPSLSGRFGLMWGVLVGVALVLHWLALVELSPFSSDYIGLIWFSVGILGGLLSSVLNWSLREKPGQSSAGNQAEQAAWPVAGAGLFLYAIAILVAVSVRGQPVILFDTIMPAAFLIYAINEAIAVRLFRRKDGMLMCWLSLGLSAVTAGMIGTAEVYLVAALGVAVTQIVPSIISMRNEPSATV